MLYDTIFLLFSGTCSRLATLCNFVMLCCTRASVVEAIFSTHSFVDKALGKSSLQTSSVVFLQSAPLALLFTVFHLCLFTSFT